MCGSADVVYVPIPRRLLNEASKRGVDVYEFVLKALADTLQLDPDEVAKARVELAEKFLDEARECLARGDAVQASEKLYKVVEECIKALAETYRTPEVSGARKEGRWWTKLLSRAAKTLSRKLNEPLIDVAWSKAYDLHVWGFHEASLDVEHVEIDLPYVEKLLEKTRSLVKQEQRTQ